MSQQVEIDGNDLVAAVAAQRNDALDNAASKAATIQALLRRIAELEKQIADANKPADAKA